MSNDEYLKKVITELSKPLDYKWKLQSYTKDKSKAMCVAYIDARMVTQRLNEVCTFGWHRNHYAIGNDTYCNLGVIMPDGSTIWRADVGESENDTERAKTSASDSFKRAAVQFGLGLFLYDLEVVKLPTKQEGNFYSVVDDKGKKVWDLTKHINTLLKKGKFPKEEEAAETKAEEPAKTSEAPKELPWLNPATKNWTHAVNRMKETKNSESKVTIETVKKSFRISKENEDKLIKEAYATVS